MTARATARTGRTGPTARTADPEAFFPEKGGSTREAKKVCRGCEVVGECLEYALEHDERFGIWGGLSERERRRLEAGDRMTAHVLASPFVFYFTVCWLCPGWRDVVMPERRWPDAHRQHGRRGPPPPGLSTPAPPYRPRR